MRLTSTKGFAPRASCALTTHTTTHFHSALHKTFGDLRRVKVYDDSNGEVKNFFCDHWHKRQKFTCDEKNLFDKNHFLRRFNSKASGMTYSLIKYAS
jgi:hypothetical protein